MFCVTFTHCSTSPIPFCSHGQSHPSRDHAHHVESLFSNCTVLKLAPKWQLKTGHIIPIILKSTNTLWSCSNVVDGFKQPTEKLAAWQVLTWLTISLFMMLSIVIHSYTWSSSLAFSPLCLIAHKLIPKAGGWSSTVFNSSKTHYCKFR